MYYRLSYTLDPETPSYKGGPRFSSTSYLSIDRGDRYNTSFFTMTNHVGTHLDTPHHFLNNGKTVDSFDISTFIFERPVLLDINRGHSELITRDDLKRFENEIHGKDLLLVRTGFGRLIRDSDRRSYEFSGPAFSSDAARYLTELKDLRALGFDFISLGTSEYEEDGQTAHRVLLAKENQPGFFIIEDMNLNHDLKSLKKVIVAPLYIRGFDGSPCTVVAETN